MEAKDKSLIDAARDGSVHPVRVLFHALAKKADVKKVAELLAGCKGFGKPVKSDISPSDILRNFHYGYVMFNLRRLYPNINVILDAASKCIMTGNIVISGLLDKKMNIKTVSFLKHESKLCNEVPEINDDFVAKVMEVLGLTLAEDTRISWMIETEDDKSCGNMLFGEKKKYSIAASLVEIKYKKNEKLRELFVNIHYAGMKFEFILSPDISETVDPFESSSYGSYSYFKNMVIIGEYMSVDLILQEINIIAEEVMYFHEEEIRELVDNGFVIKIRN